MQKNMLVALLLYTYLLPFLADSSSITQNEGIVGDNTCGQMLETFWKTNGMNIEGEYQLTTTEKLNSKPEALNRILSEREQLVKYERESIKENISIDQC